MLLKDRDALQTFLDFAHVEPDRKCIRDVASNVAHKGPALKTALKTTARPGDLALRRAMLAEHATGEAFRKRRTPAERARCRHGGGRGLPVSRRGLLQDQLLQHQIRHRLANPGILRLKILQPFDLIALQTTVFLTPAIVRNSVTPIVRIASATV